MVRIEKYKLSAKLPNRSEVEVSALRAYKIGEHPLSVEAGMLTRVVRGLCDDDYPYYMEETLMYVKALIALVFAEWLGGVPESSVHLVLLLKILLLGALINTTACIAHQRSARRREGVEDART
ncbi:MAG: hypothetical protein LM564_05705 [Desulfurococcaceae archaeon]|nr:hypothetical protein [Desulfurococcaceae archaeon]